MLSAVILHLLKYNNVVLGDVFLVSGTKKYRPCPEIDCLLAVSSSVSGCNL